MPAYRYDAVRSPFVGSISDLIAREGEIRARAAMESGQAWAGAAQNIGSDVSHAITTATDPKRQMEQIALTGAQHEQAGQQAMAGLMTPKVPVGPQPEGEGPAAPQNPYLKQEGDVSVWDAEGLSKAMAAKGFGDLTPKVMADIGTLNKAHREEAQARQAFGQAQTNVLAKGAGTALSILRDHPNADPAMVVGFIGDQMEANGTFPKEKIAQVKAQLLSDPTQLQTRLELLAKSGPMKVGFAPAGSQPVNELTGDPIGAPIPKEQTAADLEGKAMAAYGRVKAGTSTPADAAIIEGWEKTHPHQTPVRSESDQALDAYAKSIGKLKAEDLSDADRQAYIARDAKRRAKEAFDQHVNEHTYDVNHPAPTKGKSQDDLEQEARGVLRAEFSSRSGGLGVEDQKVNQAIHLRALIDQYDGKNMPAQIQAELALGLARLTSPGGTVGAELEKEFNQRTAEGGVAKAVAWLTGDPTLVNATPEKLREMFADSINRQGSVAEQNRQTYLNEMIAMLPTQLEKNRRDAIVASVTPNRMPAPKGAPATGTQRNGATWKNGAQGWGWYR